jgi:hypothetical protein
MREHVRRNRGKRDVRIPLIAMESTDTNCAASWGGAVEAARCRAQRSEEADNDGE